MKHKIVEIDSENETMSYLCKWRYRFALLEKRNFLWFTYWKTVASSDNPADFEKITNNPDIKIEYRKV
jgi:hypothetical protein